MLIIKNGTIYDAVNREPRLGTIVVKDGKIEKILYVQYKDDAAFKEALGNVGIDAADMEAV